VVSSEKVVDPGGGLVQIPVARGDKISADLIFFVPGFKTQISLYPNTEFFVRINFAPTLKTSATGSVPLILWTLRYRTKITHVE
jgi:hypothetical protein